MKLPAFGLSACERSLAFSNHKFSHNLIAQIQTQVADFALVPTNKAAGCKYCNELRFKPLQPVIALHAFLLTLKCFTIKDIFVTSVNFEFIKG